MLNDLIQALAGARLDPTKRETIYKQLEKLGMDRATARTLAHEVYEINKKEKKQQALPSPKCSNCHVDVNQCQGLNVCMLNLQKEG